MEVRFIATEQPLPAAIRGILRSRHSSEWSKVDNTLGANFGNIIRSNGLCEVFCYFFKLLIDKYFSSQTWRQIKGYQLPISLNFNVATRSAL